MTVPGKNARHGITHSPVCATFFRKPPEFAILCGNKTMGQKNAMKSMLATFFAVAALGAVAEPVKQGLWKKITYDAPDTTPIVYGGESRAENVHATDYEWLQLAERKCGRAAVDAVSRTLIRSLTDFTRDPAELERAHAAVGDMIEVAGRR